MHLRRFPTIVVLAVLAALSSRALAAHATMCLDALAEAVAARVGTTAKERTALKRAAAALRRNSTTLAADIALGTQAAKILDGAFPGDATFGAAIDLAVAQSRVDTEDHRQSLTELASVLAPVGEEPFIPGELAAQSQLDKADRLIATYGNITTWADRLARLRGARPRSTANRNSRRSLDRYTEDKCREAALTVFVPRDEPKRLVLPQRRTPVSSYHLEVAVVRRRAQTIVCKIKRKRDLHAGVFAVLRNPCRIVDSAGA